MVIGACQAVGEVTNLALFKLFPARVLACWGAGTGVAGMLGPVLFLLMTKLNWSDSAKFVALMPTALLMHLVFRELNQRALATQPRALDHESRKLCDNDASGDSHEDSGTEEAAEAEAEPLTANTDSGAGEPEHMSEWHAKSEPALHLTTHSAAQIAQSPELSRLILHCTAVYFLEYSIYPGFVDRDTHANKGASHLNRDAFILCWMAYNVGVSE